MIFLIIWWVIGIISVCFALYVDLQRYGEITLKDLIGFGVFSMFGPIMVPLIVYTHGGDIVIFKKKRYIKNWEHLK